MGKTHPAITDELRAFIERQPMFFVATAPAGGDGHVNLSPKGLDSFRVLDAHRVAYLDYVGSGNETSAHLLENGRITFMFCSFAADALILRLYGRGRTILPGTPEWPELVGHFDIHPGVRQIIDARITRVQTSCGFGVPRMDFVAHRPTMPDWATKQGEEKLLAYQQKHNARSIDGLPTPLGQTPVR
jgi:hypothetical protein